MKKKMSDIKKKFRRPGNKYASAPFWSWNGKMDPVEVRRQMRDMLSHGMGGGFMHSREGLATEYLSKEWFGSILAAMDEAKKVDGYAWLYDEDRWPSGAAGGLVTIPHPEHRQKIIEMREWTPAEFTRSGKELKIFTGLNEKNILKNTKPFGDIDQGSLSAKHQVLSFTVWTSADSAWFNDGAYLDTLSQPAVRAFIDSTYEVYKKECGKDFGKRVLGIFTDEPNFLTFSHQPEQNKDAPILPWTTNLPDEFQKRYGYSILDYLPCLFRNTDDEDRALKARHDYWECVTSFFVNNFSRQISEWCVRNKLIFTGHMLEEQSLTAQIIAVGAAMRHYEYMQMPGIDILCESIDEILTVKQCASACHQFGWKRMISELYGCTGWDFTLEGQKWLGDWQYALGVNFRCQHLSFYTMKGRAKRDYPASIFYQSPWWKYYRLLEDYYTRLSFLLSQGEAVQDILVLHPIESAWSVYRPSQSSETKQLDHDLSKLLSFLIATHYDFDLGDEEIMSRHARVLDKQLLIGQGRYRLVVIPPMITIRESTFNLLKKFAEQGGKIIAVYPYPQRVDCKKSEEAVSFFQSNAVKLVSNNQPELFRALRDAWPRLVSIKNDRHYDEIGDIIYQLREIEGQLMLFLVNTNRSITYQPFISIDTSRYYQDKSCQIEEWDPVSGKITPLFSLSGKGQVDFTTVMHPSGSRVLWISPKVKGRTKPEPEWTVVSKTVLADGFKFERDEPNARTLDFCRYRLKEKNSGEFSDWSEILPVWKAQQRIREKFKLVDITRNGGMQPWKAYPEPKNTGGRIELMFSCRIDYLPKTKVFLAVETPAIFDITVNGKTVSNKSQGWWVDRSFEKVDVTSVLKKGENTISLATDYHEEYELEDIYLMGDFGVDQSASGGPAIIEEPEKLYYGNWVPQGYPFYSGSITYFQDVLIKKDKNDKVFLNLNTPTATVIAVSVNGKRAGLLAWPPYHLEITRLVRNGKNKIAIEVVSSRRNLLGPLHNTTKPYWTSSYEFRKEQAWTDEYRFVPYGLTGEVEVVVKQPSSVSPIELPVPTGSSMARTGL
ncbi:MAG: glycosyl hydrolase [Planctomycetota bacterium]